MPSLFSTPIKKPFDPSSLKVEVKNTSIQQLYLMLKNDLIDLQPDFQRNGNLWNNKKKSRLIESILLGLPLPSFYFYIDEDNKKWVIIDGLQRLCAINDFMVKKTLRLSGLQFLKKTHTNKGFEDFSYYEQLNISMQSVTLNVISGNASAEAKYIIFRRINSEGTPLRPAEIRNALFHGKSMELIKELGRSNEFKDATDNKVSEKRLLNLDYISRFIAFYLQGYEIYESDKMEEFIGDALEKINEEYTDNDVHNLREVFYKTLYICHELLGEKVFRQPLSEKDKKNQDIKANSMSIALFESTMYALAKYYNDEEKINILILRKEKFKKIYDNALKDDSIKKYISSGTNKYKSVYIRFSTMEEVVNKTLKDDRL